MVLINLNQYKLVQDLLSESTYELKVKVLVVRESYRNPKNNVSVACGFVGMWGPRHSGMYKAIHKLVRLGKNRWHIRP